MFGSWICILWPFVRRVPTSKNVQQSRFQNHQDMQLDGYSPGWKLEVLLICSIGSTIRGWHQWVKGKNADNPRRMLPRGEYCSNTLPVSNNINRALLSAFWWEGRDEKDSELWIPSMARPNWKSTRQFTRGSSSIVWTTDIHFLQRQDLKFFPVPCGRSAAAGWVGWVGE